MFLTPHDTTFASNVFFAYLHSVKVSYLFFKICAPALHSSKCAAAARQLGNTTLSPMESKHDVKWQRRILKNLNDLLIKNLRHIFPNESYAVISKSMVINKLVLS